MHIGLESYLICSENLGFYVFKITKIHAKLYVQRQHKFKRMLKLFWLHQFAIEYGKSLFSFELIKIF